MGTFAMFSTDKDYKFEQPLSQFFASQLITLEWVLPGDGEHAVFSAESDISDGTGRALVTAYALERPDGQYSLMLINKDQFAPQNVKIVFHDAKLSRALDGPVSVATFGKEQYQWHPTATGGRADPDGPVAHRTITARKDTSYTLPAASITVIRGKLSSR